MKKRLLSGVKPTGTPHIGNYFGAMRQFVDLQDKYEAFVMIADYHALNFVQNKKDMEDNIMGVMLDYLGVGLDPDKVTIFKQSDVSAHTELTWIFDTITTMPYLMRAHAYKDAEAKNTEINVGTFNYPMLMAADILLYDPEIVPVGSDQKQHVEYARDTAQKFNRIYGDTFSMPKDFILKEVAIVPGTDGQKMSKSYKNTIPLFGTDEEIKKAVMSIVTDSEGTFPSNVFAIHKLLPLYKEDEIKKIYDEHPKEYKFLKEKLAEDLIRFISPMRERREKYSSNPELVKEILRKGSKKAKEIAENKMNLVRNNIGVTI